MRNFIFILCFPAFVYGVTLEQLIKTALHNSPYLKEKRLEIKIKKSEKNVVKGSRFGEIKLFGTAVRYENSRTLYPITPPINPTTLAGARNQLILGIRYDLPLFTGFRITNQIKVSEINRKVKELDYTLTKEELIFNITSIYLKIVSLNKLLHSLDTHKKSLKVLLENTQLYVNEGKKPEIDLLKVKYSLEDVNSKITEIEEKIKTLKSVLISYVGVEDLKLDSLEEIDSFSEPDIKNISQRISELKKIKILKEKEKILEKKIKIEKGKYFPQIYFTGSFQRNSGAGRYKDLWQVGLRLEFTLFDFGVRKHSYIKTVLNREKLRYEIKKKELELLSKIQEAVSRINTAKGKIKRAQQKLIYAQAIEKAEKVKYEEGVSDLYNYLYAKSQKILAQSELIQSIYDKYTGIAYLRFLMEVYDENN